MRGSIWKECVHDGATRRTGLPAWGKRKAVPACRTQHGYWVWRAYIGRDPATGAPVQPSRGGFSTREAAEQDLAEYAAEFARTGRRVPKNRTMTVAQFLEEWLAHLQRRVRDNDLEPTSYRNYETDVRVHIVPALGDIPVRELRLPMVSQWLAGLGARTEAPARRPAPSNVPERQLAAVRGIPQGLEPTPLLRRRIVAAGYLTEDGQLTAAGEALLESGNVGAVVAQLSRAAVNKARRTLRAALTWGLEQDLVDVNAAAGRISPAGRRPVDDSVCWQPEELAAFFAYVTAQADPDVALWMIAGFTGARRSELLGLPWTAVDLGSGQPGIWIRQKVVEVPGPQPCPFCEDGHRGRLLRGVQDGEQGTKSAAGRRWVPIPADATGLLLAHQIEQSQHRDRLGKAYVDHGLVFAGPTGEPRRPDAVTDRFQVLAREAGVPESRFHGVRHATVSLYGAVGASTTMTGLIAGHASTAVTQRYTHAVRSAMSAASERLAQLIEDAGAGAR